jgi:hypothetical protein
MKRVILSLVILMFIAAGAQAGVIFSDDFGSYTADTDYSLFGASSDWSRDDASDTNYDVKVGTWYGGRALFQNNYWADTEVDYAVADATAGLSDYVVSAEGSVHEGYTSSSSEWYVAGRVSSGSYVRVGAVIANDVIYARYADSSGVSDGDYYIADYDANSPAISMELSLDGSSVVATVSHAGFSHTFDTTTSVTGAGEAGFGGRFKWGYANMYFDNFEASEIPEPATIGLLTLGLGFIVRKRK